jgi:hypothetical protein
MLLAAAGVNFLEDNPLGNVLRLILAFVGMLMVMLCLRVGWLRWRNPDDDELQQRSPMALVSYATFAALPTGHMLSRFGMEPDWILLASYALALGTGIIASFSQVTIRLWWRRPKHRADATERR